MPVWYFLGAGALIWAIPGLVLGLDLVRRRTLRMPPGSGILLVLLGWFTLTGMQLRTVPALGLFAYRLSAFASMAAIYIWLANSDRRSLPTRTIVQLLGALWLVLVVFGYLAILFPDVSVASPIQRLLPGALTADPYVRDLTNISLAEPQGFLGYPVPRPSAPMAYANGWGSTLGLLTPFFILGWLIDATRRRRVIGTILLLAGVVPAVVSLNRGLWLSTALMFFYVAGRSVLDGNRRLAIKVVVGAVVLVGVVSLSPLQTLITDKVSGADDGDATRSSAYEEAIAYTRRSPIVGYGAPVAIEHVAVAVGTHGLIWYLLVSHGVPGAALFLLWLAGVVRRGLPLRSTTGMWATSSVVVCVFQIPIYGLLPQIVLAGAFAAVIGREREAAAAT